MYYNIISNVHALLTETFECGEHETRASFLTTTLRTQHFFLTVFIQCIDFLNIFYQEKPVRVNIGWLNYSFKEKRYIQVKNTAKNPGNGSTSVIIQQSSNFEETKRILEEEFFPNGKNSKGKLSGMETSLGYFTGKEIAREQFQSVGDWINEEKVLHQRARLYLLTKKKVFLHKAYI